MPDFQRYAVYVLPDDPSLAAFGASWLGWDIAAGLPCVQPDIAGLNGATATPRRYGFHATLKPPFRLADGTSTDGLARDVSRLAYETSPITLDGLSLATIGRFLALVAVGDTTALDRFAFACVTRLDAFRAPQSEAELARRRAAGLTSRQEDNLNRWGYPHVDRDFRFHMTLSGKLDPASLSTLRERAAERLPPLPAPFEITTIALVGEDPDGLFRLIERYALTG